MPAFGLNDDDLKQFGLSDDDVGQPAVTQAPYAVRKQPKINPIAANYGGEPVTPAYSQEQLNAAQQGVDVDSGADAATQEGLGFSGNNDEKLSYIAARMQQKFSRPVQVRVGPDSKEPEYFSPKTQKWTIAGSSGIAAGAIDNTLSLAGGLGGFALGAATGNPFAAAAGSVTGSGLGSAAGEAAKLKVGKAIGAVDPNYPIGSDVATAGLRGAAFDVGAQLGVGAYKYGRYWFKGSNAFGSKEAIDLGAAAAKADKLIADVESKLGEGSFKPTLGQRVANEPMNRVTQQRALDLEAAAEKDPVIGPQLRALYGSNEDALTAYFDASSEPFIKKTVDGAMQLSSAEASKATTQGLTSGYDALMDASRKIVSQLPEELPASEAGKVMRSALAQADRAFKTTIEDPAWAKYRQGTGYNPKTYSSTVRVPWDDSVRDLMGKWDSRSREAILGAIRSDNSELKLLFRTKPDEPASAVLGPDGLPWRAAQKGKEVNDVDLSTLDDTIKWVRSDARSALKNKQGVSYNEKDLVDLERTLTNMRNNYLKESKPELYGMLQEAESATKMRAAQFKNSAIGDLLVKDGPDSYRLGDAESVYRIITSKDDTAAKQFADLTKGYPEAKSEAQQMIYALYRKAVVDPRTGAPSPKAHAAFMRDYGQVIRNFFPGAEDATFQRLGGLGTQIAKEQQQLQAVLPAFKRLFGGQIESLNSSALAKNTLSTNFSKEKVDIAVNLLKKNGQQDLISEWQHATIDTLGKTLIKDGQVNSGQLIKLLNGPQKDVLERLLNANTNRLGTQYVNDLKVLQEATDMVRTQGKGNLESQSRGLFVRLARTVFGAFSPEGRLVTLGQSTRAKAAPAGIYKAITDPSELRRIAKDADKTMDQIRNATVISSIGQTLTDGNFNY